MTDYSELKRLAEDVNNNFPDKEDLWSMVCTPTVALDLIADYDQLKAENERLECLLEIKKIDAKTYREASERFQAENETLVAAAQALRDEWRKDQAENEALRKALSELLDLYDTDEGCRSLPQYIAGRAALGKGVDHG